MLARQACGVRLAVESTGGGVKPQIETFQAEFELDQLVRLVESLQPSRILEVGCWHGGTLWHWLQHAQSVTAVDDMMRGPGPDEWERWADAADTELYLIKGDSHLDWVVRQAESHGPYDFVFIDADHSYASVKGDWEHYRPLVAEGGVVAFHDIVARPGYGVSELWGEIKAVQGARWMEIVETVAPENESRCGIGVLFL